MEVVERDLGGLGLGFGGNRAERTTFKCKMLYFIGIFSKLSMEHMRIRFGEKIGPCVSISGYLDEVGAGSWDERGYEKMRC